MRAWLAVAVVVLGSGLAHAEAITRIAPPEQGFFSKRLDYDGIPIKAHADVSDDALFKARDKLALLLDHRPAITAQLVKNGVELHIIGKDQVTSDLPEWRSYKGKPFDGNMDIDQRTRGMGGKLSSCGEENLLELPNDRYVGRDICVHEFAHAIALLGVTPEVRQEIEDTYQRAMAQGLWSSTYASTNVEEYFAELSMWYVGSQGDHGTLSPEPRPGRAWLESYDPDGAALLDDIYSGRLVGLFPARVSATRQTGASTWIRFANTWTHDVTLWWLDDHGTRHRYRSLAPGDQYDQQTFAGHAWLVTNGHGDAITAFVAEPTARVARITH